jgi:hypothetical protein
VRLNRDVALGIADGPRADPAGARAAYLEAARQTTSPPRQRYLAAQAASLTGDDG